MSVTDFKPIDGAAKDGSDKIVKRGDDLARAYWLGGIVDGMWAYGGTRHQVDFEPNYYRNLEPKP